MTESKPPIPVEISEETLVAAFNGLTKTRRIRLISRMASRLATDISGIDIPDKNADEETMKRWLRLTLIRDEAGLDTTIWSDDLSEEYNENPFSEEEELMFVLFAIENLGNTVRYKWAEKKKAKKLSA